ncbi:hypothetical protein [Streptomyces tibetensis]|uniref:hypothetical protein n=1 Tax=Streptomyces tibetensis TaxID=2382123 RepID=UPI0033F9A73C
MLVIAVTVLLVLIAVGVVLIHQLNRQHDERIAAFHYSDALPGIGRRSRRHRRSPADASVPTDPTATAAAYDSHFGPTAGGRGRRVTLTRQGIRQREAEEEERG